MTLDGTKIAANGITFNTRIDGREGAPWLTFSNSLATNHTMWDDQVAALADDYRIFRYDTRGHGATDAPEGPYDFDLLIGDVIALWDAAGIGASHFVGLSLGGMTGMGLALAHPERVSSLIACDCRAVADPHFVSLWQENIPLVEAGGTAAVVDATLGRWFNAGWAEANPERIAAIREMVLATPKAGYLGCARAIQGLDFLRRLSGLTVPALFLGGAQDPGAPVEMMDAMCDAAPGARRAVIDPAAHIANIENTPAFNAAITGFLSAL